MKRSDILPDIIKAAADYSLATGIVCRQISLKAVSPDRPGHGSQERLFYDEQEHSLRNRSAVDDEACWFCSRYSSICGSMARCFETHRYAAYQAERFGGTYLYLCRMSLLHWAAPVIFDGMLSNGLICGPVMIFDIDEFLADEYRRKFSLTDDQVQVIFEHLSEVPKITAERATSLAEVLFFIAMGLSDNDARTFFDDRLTFEQQSRIGDYLQGIKTMEGEKRSDLNYPIEKERELLRYVAAGNKRDAEHLLEEIIGIVLYSTGVNLDMVKSRILELAVLLSRAAVEGGADAEQIFGLNCHYLIKIRNITTLEELTSWTSRIMERFVDLVFNLRSVRHTQKILHVIREVAHKYAGKMSMKMAAESVQLSPSYFSRLFKQEMGISFSDYLNDVRVEQAKKLLLSTGDSLGDVGFSCGFDDQSYFSKVFKHRVGISPNRYRETGGRVIKSRP